MMFKPSKTLQLLVAAVIVMVVVLCVVADPTASRTSAAGGHHPFDVAEQSSSPLAISATTTARTFGLALSSAGVFRGAPEGLATKSRLAQDPNRLRAAEACFTPPLRI